MNKGEIIIQFVISCLSIIQRNNTELFQNCNIRFVPVISRNRSDMKCRVMNEKRKEKHPVIVTRCSCYSFKDKRLKDQRDPGAVDDAQHNAAQHVGQVVYPQIHTRKRDRARQQQCRDPDPRGTAPCRDRKGAKG